MVGGFLFRLQLGPGGGIVVVTAVALCLIQGLELCGEWGECSADGFEPLLLLGLILLQFAEPFGPLAAALEQGAVVAPGRIALGDQGCLLLFQFAQLGFLLLDQLRQLRLLPPAGHQRFPQFQQAPPQGFGFVLIAAAAKAEAAASLGEAAAGHGAALLQQLAIQGHRPGAAQLLAGTGQVGEHQGVTEDVSEHLVVDRLEPHQFHGPADQSSAAVPTGACPPGKSG